MGRGDCGGSRRLTERQGVGGTKPPVPGTARSGGPTPWVVTDPQTQAHRGTRASQRAELPSSASSALPAPPLCVVAALCPRRPHPSPGLCLCSGRRAPAGRDTRGVASCRLWRPSAVRELMWESAGGSARSPRRRHVWEARSLPRRGLPGFGHCGPVFALPTVCLLRRVSQVFTTPRDL